MLQHAQGFRALQANRAARGAEKKSDYSTVLVTTVGGGALGSILGPVGAAIGGLVGGVYGAVSEGLFSGGRKN